MDTVDQAKRSEIMSKVGQKDTGPEMLLRSALHQRGLRYRLHERKLPGSPDLVFPKYHALIFVHGCYWHSHGCYRSTVPKTRREFWVKKFEDNKMRDQRNTDRLSELGWRVLIVWECALKGKKALPLFSVAEMVNNWLLSSETLGEISPPHAIES
ncbi:MAG: very short patch repair endonuclease [Pseudomonadales bacterium]|nr:very short patch repair endonuclease [Pseudomonadales bacterium]